MSAANIERRSAPGEIRAAGRRLTGYAAVFGVEARIGSIIESIAPHAFAASLTGGADILALSDHDPTRVLARTRTGSLKLVEDNKGLQFEFEVPATQAGNDVLALATRGDLGGMSFGFTLPPGGERRDGNRRTLLRVNLLEISTVSAWPAYEGTSVAARSQAPRLALALRYLDTV